MELWKLWKVTRLHVFLQPQYPTTRIRSQTEHAEPFVFLTIHYPESAQTPAALSRCTRPALFGIHLKSASGVFSPSCLLSCPCTTLAEDMTWT